VAKLRAELQNVLEWSLVEKAPLRAQEIKSIRAALRAKAQEGRDV
jgi:chloramphenicol 3-O-phosphotransferase